MISTLLLSSKSLWSQTKENADSLVVVPLELIQQANIKLAEGKHYKEISEKQSELIFDLEELNYTKTEQIKSLANDNYTLYTKNKQYEDINKSLEKSLARQKTYNYILCGIDGDIVLFLINDDWSLKSIGIIKANDGGSK